jgi:uncharacterized membrane protein YraQ (UPF0718 family)
MNVRRKALSVVARLWPWLAVVAVAGLWAYGRFGGGPAFGLRAGESLRDFVAEMALVLPPMFVLVGLFEVWVPRAVVERNVGRNSGAAAIFWMVLLATVQAGPLYGAFPVAVSLWRKGCAPRNVFIYLGAFSAMKIPMLTFEVAFLGWSFSLARTFITLPVFIAIGVLKERLLPDGFVLPAVDASPNDDRKVQLHDSAPELDGRRPGSANHATEEGE